MPKGPTLGEDPPELSEMKKFELFECGGTERLNRWKNAQAYTPAKCSLQEQSVSKTIAIFKANPNYVKCFQQKLRAARAPDNRRPDSVHLV